MSATDLTTIFASTEARYALRPGVLRSLAQQESGTNPWAYRYEPGFYLRYIAGKPRDDLGGTWPLSTVSEPSERWARSVSWGLLQVMGQTARELGFVAPFLSQLCDPVFGVEYGALFLSKKLALYHELPDALSAYNAGTPQDYNRESYVAPILARLA